MNKSRMRLMVVLFLLAVPALAQPARTFVSASTGNDLNPCTLANPCRNFWRGVEAVATNGEVVPLDSGGYGTLTISKQVTIAVPAGVYAGITATAPASAGVTFDTAGVAAFLRGISINGLGGADGVSVPVAGVTLHLDRATVSGFPGAAIKFTSNGGRLFVKDSFIRDTGLGIQVSSTDFGNRARAMIDRVRLNGNGGSGNSAISANDYSAVTVHNTTAAGNFRGFEVRNSGLMMLENSASTGNVVGLFATGGDQALMRVSNSLIAHNTLFGIEAQGGSEIGTRGNNTVVDNNAGETFTDTFVTR